MYEMQGSVWFGLALLPFLCAALFHLKYCFYERHNYADITKTVLMPLLLAAYLIGAFTAGKMPSVLMTVALIAGWFGDLFLLRSDKKSFVFGVLSFGTGHILYTAFAVMKLGAAGTLNLPVLCILAVLYAGLMLFLMLRLFRYLKAMTKPVFGYMLLIAGMSICFVLYAFEQPSLASGCAAAGSVFFVLSDSLLARVEFIGGFPKSRFAVMASYLLAQLCIAGSAVLL